MAYLLGQRLGRGDLRRSGEVSSFMRLDLRLLVARFTFVRPAGGARALQGNVAGTRTFGA